MKNKIMSKDAAMAAISLAQALSIHKSVEKHNAYEFFQDLILSLTKHKKKWTPTQRMQYNRVAKFLEA